MTGEYPYLYHEADFDAFGYDGALIENMTICVDSYIGEPAGGQGLKLEQQVLLTADGPEFLSSFPRGDARLLKSPAVHLELKELEDVDRAALAVVTFRPGATATPDELPEFIATKVAGWCLSGSRPSGLFLQFAVTFSWQ